MLSDETMQRVNLALNNTENIDPFITDMEERINQHTLAFSKDNKPYMGYMINRASKLPSTIHAPKIIFDALVNVFLVSNPKYKVRIEPQNDKTKTVIPINKKTAKDEKAVLCALRAFDNLVICKETLRQNQKLDKDKNTEIDVCQIGYTSSKHGE